MIKFVSIILALFLFLVFCAGCSNSSEMRAVDTVIQNPVIIDVQSGALISGKSVLISNGLVEDIVNTDQLGSVISDNIIEAEGSFLMPALADVHVHIQTPMDLQNFVRHGVGLVVNMSGSRAHLSLRDQVAAGEVIGPAIMTAGPTLDGDPPTNPLFTSVNPDNAHDIVAWIAKQDYDAIKVYQQMDVDTLAAVVSSAIENGLITTGHVSRTAGIDAVLSAGQRYFAHGEELAFESFDEDSRSYKLNTVPELAKSLSMKGVTVTPMLAYLQNIPQQVADLGGYLGQEEMRSIPASMRLSFDANQGWFSNREDPEGFIGQIESLAAWVARLVTELDEHEVQMVLGTDAGFGGAIPGFSVHQELKALVAAGMNELAALQTATVNVGQYLRELDDTQLPWGQVRPGFAASLLLVASNPLENISATRNIQGVMMSGKWFDSASLHRMKEEAEARQSELLPEARAFEKALIAGDLEELELASESKGFEHDAAPLISPSNCIFLGYRHYYGGKRALAGSIYQQCAEMHPKSAPLWIHIARAYQSEENYEGARKAYETALELNPWFGDPQAEFDKLDSIEKR